MRGKDDYPEVLILTMVSEAYLPIYYIWKSRMKHLQLENYIVIAQDSVSFNIISSSESHRVIRGFDELEEDGKQNGKNEIHYGSTGWKRKIERKASFVASYVMKNKAVLYCDIDVIFFRNPVPFLMKRVRSVAMTHGIDRKDGFLNYNSGFIFFKPTDTGKRVAVLWKQESKEIYKYKTAPYDQRALNTVLTRINIDFPDFFELPVRLFQLYAECEALPTRCLNPYVLHFAGLHNPIKKRETIEIFLKRLNLPYSLS
eukprot:gene5059-6970_t